MEWTCRSGQAAESPHWTFADDSGALTNDRIEGGNKEGIETDSCLGVNGDILYEKSDTRAYFGLWRIIWIL
ncbi:hypothetical protein VFPPC_16941 [Pochonia chlamydosporia 170]|uniref:Uncharacterized protein n=1 Tax=Pochonia chlamydosporia 170 TaxID=1380566 RepID=A0A179F0L0_METCM|nr:hypothetical protein VFPPC_16941 [Pochonia chlamydosporia 170]OAQ58689.1 hypothetical protein VFPPC_16941 [Pochonia chlamydosporia 170]